jgi:hypothetical protein
MVQFDVQASESNQGETLVRLFDQQGKLLATRSVNIDSELTKIYMSDLTLVKGLYLLSVNNNQSKASAKVLVQ